MRLRADRTGGVHDELYLAAETDLGAILTHVEQVRPEVLVVDSIQTIAAPSLDGVPGGVTQVKEVAAALIRVAKTRNITTIIVGHVTKDGSIAGPRVLEHVVDVVLHFEGDRNSRFRMVRAMKNRFGPIDEVGCFDLGAEGITAVTDPTGLFVENHQSRVPGTCVAVVDGGAAADAGRGPGAGHQEPARATSPYDVRARLVAGRDDPGGPPAALRHRRCYSAGRLRLDRRRRPADRARQRPRPRDRARVRRRPVASPPQGIVALGEISLAGEVRKVRDLPQRLAEAARLGFRVAVAPVERPPSRARTPDGRRHDRARGRRPRRRPGHPRAGGRRGVRPSRETD